MARRSLTLWPASEMSAREWARRPKKNVAATYAKVRTMENCRTRCIFRFGLATMCILFSVVRAAAAVQSGREVGRLRMSLFGVRLFYMRLFYMWVDGAQAEAAP
jgi:hypothetical protein